MRYRGQVHVIVVVALVCACLELPIGPATAQLPPANPFNQQTNNQKKKAPQRKETQADRQSQDARGETIKIPTEMVQLDVKVTDQNGLPVPGLTKADFAVYEDKVSQDIDSVSNE